MATQRERIAKLPVWAQELIRHKDMQIQELNRLVHESVNYTTDRDLPGLHVGSTFGPHRHFQAERESLKLILRDGMELSIQVTESEVVFLQNDPAGRQLVIQPQAGNALALTSKER